MIDPNALCVEAISYALCVHVSTEVPPERPQGRFIQVSRTGGEDTPFILRPIMSLICWADTDEQAYALATDAAYALIDCAADHPYLSAAELQNLSRDMWSADGSSRYVAQIRLTINND